MAQIKIKLQKTCNGIPYTIEASLEDLRQVDEIGKVVGAVEQWIQEQFKPNGVVFADLSLIVEPKP